VTVLGFRSCLCSCLFFFSSRRRHTRLQGDWSSDVCSSDLFICCCMLARQNAATNKVAANFLNADAECLPFADETFDLVYSWGVLHHSPDVARTLQEIHRVLRPGGECRAMLYHRHSLVASQCYLRYGLGRLRPFIPLSDLIAA